MKVLIVVVLVVVGVIVAPVRLLAATSWDGAEVSTNAPLAVLVEGLPIGAERLGLTEDTIQTRVELALRRSGVRVVSTQRLPIGECHLYVRVSVIGTAFSWEVEIHRPLAYVVDGKNYSTIATTWETSSLGTHSGDRQFILNSLSEGVDKACNALLGARLDR